jgi:hypothetical protein
MDLNNHQGWFGEAFVGVLAAAAGLQHAKPYPDFGIDLEVRRDHVDPALDSRIDLQVKTQRIPDPDSIGEGLTVRLDARQYRKLIGIRQVRAYLIVVGVPDDPANYIQASVRSLVLNHCAYWTSLENDPCPLREDQERVSVRVPSTNLLTATVLRELLDNNVPAGAVL